MMNYHFDFDVGATISVSKRELGMLVACAKSHYDGVCNEAGLRIGESPESRSFVATRNGFLAVAMMEADGTFGDSPKEQVDVHLSTRQLDTCLKILEQAHLLSMRGDFADHEAHALSGALRRILIACCAKRKELTEASERAPA